MSTLRHMRSSVIALVLAQVAPIAAGASTTHYFYDPIGRYIGQTTTGTQVRANHYDAANNRTSYLANTAPSPTSSQALSANQSIFQGQALTSADGRYGLAMQEDGNLVLYHGSTPIWSTATSNTNAATLIMQGDGNLVLYNAQYDGVWSSGTAGNPGAGLAVQTDGNLVVYSSQGQALWNSGTAGK